jgi:CO/xanthine dehydrogenase FAD-binding subunit
MKPAAFKYCRATTVGEALALLKEHGPDAKILAGGQSLIPMMNFRLFRPAVLVDINRVSELDFVEDGIGSLRIGALTRHRVTETAESIRRRFPVVPAAMSHVAHLAIRNRGTLGGSLSHADPSAELALLAILLDAKLKLRSADRERTVDAQDFFLGALTTALEEGEILSEVELPHLPHEAGWGFEEVAQRTGDYAIVSAAAIVAFHDGRCAEVRIAVGGAETPIRAAEAEAILAGAEWTRETIRAASESAGDAAEWNDDMNASRAFRRQLVVTSVRRALDQASQSGQRAAA